MLSLLKRLTTTSYPISLQIPFQNPTLEDVQRWLLNQKISRVHQVALMPNGHFGLWVGKPVKTIPSNAECPCIRNELTQARQYLRSESTGKLVPLVCTRHPKQFSLNVDLARARQQLDKMGQLPDRAKGKPVPLTVADVLDMKALPDVEE